MVSSTVQQRDLQKRVALLDHLQHYLHSLGSESRKKHANVKDASEQGIALVKSLQEKLINQQKERQDIRDGNLQREFFFHGWIDLPLDIRSCDI